METTNKSSHPHCTGRAAEALEAFHERQAELRAMQHAKPDMIAYKELRQKYVPEKQHGHIEGVPVGVELQSRREAAILGIHTQILRGIDAVKDESCYAVCISGGYVDDDDHDPDGTIIYAGVGGQDKQKGKHQVKDQTEDAYNASLLRSIDTGLPIRVLRGHHGGKKGNHYYYDGLYQCIEYTYEPSADTYEPSEEGPMVYKFILEPIEKQNKSIQVEADAKTRSPTGDRVRDRLLATLPQHDTQEAAEAEIRRNATKPSYL